jgi:glycosyltransferase involved in cell wall biosynthesis
MAMGRPIITTNASGCKETVKEGVNGFLVPVASIDILAEKMIWFIEHSEHIEPMGIASRRMVEKKFDVRKVNAKMLDIIVL